jgi:outer membrane protein
MQQITALKLADWPAADFSPQRGPAQPGARHASRRSRTLGVRAVPSCRFDVDAVRTLPARVAELKVRDRVMPTEHSFVAGSALCSLAGAWPGQLLSSIAASPQLGRFSRRVAAARSRTCCRSIVRRWPTTPSTRPRGRPPKPDARSCRRRWRACCRPSGRAATPSGTTPSTTGPARPDRQSYQNKYNSNSYGVNLTQPLFRWQNFVQYDQSKLLVMQTEANFAQAGQDLILRVAQAYFDVLFALENLRAVQANKTAIAQQLEQAKKNFEVGTATITDTYESQSRFDLATAQEIAAESDLEVKRYALSVLVGKDPGELNRLKPTSGMEPPQPASMEPVGRGCRTRQFCRAGTGGGSRGGQQGRRHQSRRLITRRSMWSPTTGRTMVRASLGSARSTPRPARLVCSSISRFFRGGLSTREPAKRPPGATRNGRAGQCQAQRSARRASVLPRRGQWLAGVRALEAALVSSLSSLESNRLGYEVGVRINIDVLNAENQVYVTRRDLAKARFDTLISPAQAEGGGRLARRKRPRTDQFAVRSAISRSISSHGARRRSAVPD